MLELLFDFIKNNIIALGFIGTGIAGTFNLYRFNKIREDEQKQRSYENYHNLIERLNLPENITGYPLLDKQKSAAFELRNYPNYKNLTHDILSNWIKRTDDFTDLQTIMKETLAKLKVPYSD